MKKLLLIFLVIFGLIIAMPALAKNGVKVFSASSTDVKDRKAINDINRDISKWLENNPDIKIVKTETDTNLIAESPGSYYIRFYITVTIQYTVNPKTQ